MTLSLLSVDDAPSRAMASRAPWLSAVAAVRVGERQSFHLQQAGGPVFASSAATYYRSLPMMLVGAVNPAAMSPPAIAVAIRPHPMKPTLGPSSAMLAWNCSPSCHNTRGFEPTGRLAT